ncbi:methionine--tRNA ligase [Perspicuibacillus lycopersici]
MSIFIGGAWPYANGSLHLGHISSLLPGDILARYYRQRGENVLYVSGSDCNGTPIAIRAKQENVPVKEITDRYHAEFAACFSKLGFSYDIYTRTDNSTHHQAVQEIFLQLMENGFIYKKVIEQTYCESCVQFLPDRYVEGICPNCGKQARGDQCDFCSTILDPLDLLDKRCKLCGSTPTVKETEHFYFSISKWEDKLTSYVNEMKSKGTWRDNAIQLTERYINEGLHDRAVSRDLPLGVNIPVAGYEDKKIYVWIEAVSGYYTASIQWAKETGQDLTEFWGKNTISYYIHGKDNIPFHTVIWPAILLGLQKQEALPDYIVSNEYVTLEKKKLSTSRNWAVWVPDILERYEPDSIRYFLTINAPENRDTDFSWREFIYSHNSELLGGYGNFVHRTLKFIEKNYNGVVPRAKTDANIQVKIEKLYRDSSALIENAHFKQALELIFAFIRDANKYFDEQKPWKTITENKTECDEAIYHCVLIIANLTQLLAPFLPFSSNQLAQWLSLPPLQWEPISAYSGKLADPVKPLFTRIDIQCIDSEIERLYQQATNF